MKHYGYPQLRSGTPLDILTQLADDGATTRQELAQPADKLTRKTIATLKKRGFIKEALLITPEGIQALKDAEAEQERKRKLIKLEIKL